MFIKSDLKDLKAEISSAKNFREISKSEEEFFNILFKLRFTEKCPKGLLIRASKLAAKVPWLKGWPKDSGKFWDLESIHWNNEISANVRKAIGKELSSRAKGRNLSLGSGIGSYVQHSVLVDISRKMLEESKNKKKVLYDLNKGFLPFKDKSFDNAELVFVINYLEDLPLLLKELKRIVRKKIFVVQNLNEVTGLFKTQQKKFWKREELSKLLKNQGFSFNMNEMMIESKLFLFVEVCVS